MCVWQWCSEEITKYISDNLPYALLRADRQGDTRYFGRDTI